MPRKNVRVDIPRDPSEAIALLGKIKKKHEDLGDASPLKDLEWGKFGPAQVAAAEHDGKADEFRAKSETEIGERNRHMPAVKEALPSIRDVLLGLYRSNPKKLAEWFFDVDDSAQASGDKADDDKAKS